MALEGGPGGGVGDEAMHSEIQVYRGEASENCSPLLPFPYAGTGGSVPWMRQALSICQYTLGPQCKKW